MTFWDHVYADNTLLRTEIGNARDYDDCTIRMIQLMTASAAGSFEFELRTTPWLAAEDTLYVFLTESEGTTANRSNLVGVIHQP